MLNDQDTELHNAAEIEGGSSPDTSMIVNWTDENTAKFQKEIMSFQHRLAETGLFTDEALANLLERHPAEMLDVCTMGDADHPVYPNRFRTGDFRDVPGQVLIDAAKAGRVWINARQAMNVHADYKRELDKMYGELAEKTGNKTFKPRGGILISSPVAKVPYHVDKTETILWHVRGKKRIYLYPMTDEFISDKGYEESLTNATDDDLPYNVAFEDAATAVDIPENTALTWRLNQPHRVDNQTFCVSVTTEYSTSESMMKNAAMYTNAALRHRLGLNPSYTKDGALTRKTKSFFGRVIKKAGLVPNTATPDLVTFRIDPNAADFIVDVEPYQRSF